MPFYANTCVFWGAGQNQYKPKLEEISEHKGVSNGVGSTGVWRISTKENVIYMDGYAVLKTDEFDDDKTVKVIFKNIENSYEVLAKQFYYDWDMGIATEEINEETISKENRLFWMKCNMNEMKEGVYDIYIEVSSCGEDDVLKRYIGDSGWKCVRAGNTIEMLHCDRIQNFEDDIPVITLENQIWNDFGSSQIYQDYYLVNGYVGLPGGKEIESVYVEIRDSVNNIYTFPVVETGEWRADINGVRCSFKGFYNWISCNEFLDTDVIMSIIIKDIDGKLYSSGELAYYRYTEGRYYRNY